MTENDEKILQEMFYVSFHSRQDAIMTRSAKTLADADEMKAFLSEYAPLIRSQVLAPAATYLAGWLGGLCAAMQYLLSHSHALFDFSLENTTIQLVKKGEKYGFAFILNSSSEVKIQANSRNAWIKAELSKFYRDTIRPLIESSAEASGYNIRQLWLRLPSTLHRYRDVCLSMTEKEALKETIEADFQMLRSLDAAKFGIKQNPFNAEVKWIDHPFEEGRQMRMKSSCCQYYRTDGGRYCYACPRMKDSERQQRRAENMAKAKSSCSTAPFSYNKKP